MYDKQLRIILKSNKSRWGINLSNSNIRVSHQREEGSLEIESSWHFLYMLKGYLWYYNQTQGGMSVSLYVCLFVCLFICLLPIYFKTAVPNELKFWEMIPLSTTQNYYNFVVAASSTQWNKYGYQYTCINTYTARCT